MKTKAVIKVYGREQLCASCVGAPGSKDTYEWLQAAINRKFERGKVSYEYIDMDKRQENVEDQQMVAQMEEEELFYPLVLLNGKIIAEGVPYIKHIFQAIEETGIDKIS